MRRDPTIVRLSHFSTDFVSLFSPSVSVATIQTLIGVKPGDILRVICSGVLEVNQIVQESI